MGVSTQTRCSTLSHYHLLMCFTFIECLVCLYLKVFTCDRIITVSAKLNAIQNVIKGFTKLTTSELIKAYIH